MKFRVTMKTPDELDDSIKEAVKALTERLMPSPDFSEEEREQVAEFRGRVVRAKCSKWFEHGEYLTVEIDTEEGSCVVVERGR